MQPDTKLNILMVEDNPGDELLLSELLSGSGLAIGTVHKAGRMSEAVAMIQQYPVDIILLDLSLPDASGIDSFKSMRKAAVKIPIVILSGLADMTVALDAINLGAQDYLIKGDFDEKLLAKIILYSVERMRSLIQLKESNERYNLVSQATNDMVWDWDLVTGEVYRNKEGWKKIFRCVEQETEVGSIDDWDSRIHPEDEGKVKLVNDEIQFSLKDFFEVECRMKRDDGSYVYIHDRGNIIRNEQGKAIRLIGATQDITLRKEAELQVAKSESRFRSLVQNGSDLISILDENACYLYSSPAVKRILGYAPEFMLGKNALSFIHPDDIVKIKARFAMTKTGEYFEATPFRFKNKKGEWRWLESKITDMSANPEIQGYILNSRDVTERKIAEDEINTISQELRNSLADQVLSRKKTEESETRLKESQAIAHLGHWELNFTTQVALWSDEACRIYGLLPGENKLAYSDWVSFIHPEDLDYVMATTSASQKTFSDTNMTHRIVLKDGTIKYITAVSKFEFDENGKPVGLYGVTHDVTESKIAEEEIKNLYIKEKAAEEILKASEERYRYLFNNNPASIIIWDINTLQILEVNNTAVEQHGYSREDFLSKTIMDQSPAEQHDKLKDFIERVRQKENFKSVITSRYLNKSGEEIYLSIASHRVQYKGRAVIMALATNVTENVSLERVLEEERVAKQQEITDAVISAQEQERQELGGELHDNIIQILAGSLLYLGLAKKELPEEHPYLKETETLISSAITEIRNLSHSLIPPSLHESELLGAINHIIETTQQTSGMLISLQAFGFDESSLPDKLKLSIYRIVQEQFNNILKHAAAQKVIVRLVQDNEKTTLTIKDDGVGFDTNKKPNGVGLMNIKTRASLFNGDVTIISSPGKGCELKVMFN